MKKGIYGSEPPTQGHPEDVAPLVAAFIHEFNPKHGKGTGITPEALTRLPVYARGRCRIWCQGPVIANVIPGL